MRLLNYTSSTPAEQSILEIQKMLVHHGASSLLTDFDGPHVAAVSFKMTVQGQDRAFRLPCNWRAVKEALGAYNQNRKRRNGRLEDRVDDSDAQAIRTAWRILKDWIEAQLALVQVNMVTVPQIFLPYTIMRNGKTLSEHIEENPSGLLGDGK